MPRSRCADGDGERGDHSDLGGVWQEQLGTGLSNNPFTLTYSANGQAIAMRNGSFNLGGGTVTYLHSDHLGSASAVSNAAGAIITTATYDPWGQVVEGGMPQTDKGYTGQQRDDTGLMWYQSRLYDPNLGRFLSADTIVPGSGALTIWPSDSTASASWSKLKDGGPANPQELNRYSYVNNNPLGATDPTGHCGDITDLAGDCPGENKDAWTAGGSSGGTTGNGGNWTGQIGSIFAQETLKAVGQAALNAGAAVLRNPGVQRAMGEAVINGIINASTSLLVDGGMNGDRGNTLAGKVLTAGVAGVVGGAAGSVGTTPLKSVVFGSSVAIMTAHTMSHGSNIDLSKSFGAEVLTSPIGISAEGMPRHVQVPVLILKALVGQGERI